MNYAKHVKRVLEANIEDLFSQKERYCVNPDKNFTRNKKLGFKELIKMLISMEAGTLNSEILNYFEYDSETITASAFIQQRAKLKAEVFSDLFYKFNREFEFERKYKGYRIIACDGSDLTIYNNPNDPTTYYQTTPDRNGYNMMHLDACYDLCNRRYTDFIVSPGQDFNEPKAMTIMMDRYEDTRQTIFIADRGYESYNVFIRAMENDLKFLIRVKDRNSTGMLKGYNKYLPESEEFDVDIERILTKKQTKFHFSHPEIYRIIPTTASAEYFTDGRTEYPIKFRILRFAISDESYECIITNLSREEFDVATIKSIYQMRWGIETSFRELKHAIGITAFHSRKVEFIRQEIYARIIMYNFCELITIHTLIERANRKYDYHLNYTMAINICRKYFRCRKESPPFDIEKLLFRYIQPTRPGRKDRRKVVKSQPAVSFVYRVAA